VGSKPVFPGVWGLRLSARVWDRAALGLAVALSVNGVSWRLHVCSDSCPEGSGTSGIEPAGGAPWGAPK
jgi:hypothetical protein